MNKNKNSRSGFIQLYNPKKEGLGAYDIHYINANKRKKAIEQEKIQSSTKRQAAWFHLLEA